MIKVNKISMSVLDKYDELGNSKLEFKISGSDINYVIVNTIRRTIFSDVPIYAFNIFKFEKNTSVFHNNYLKLRLQHMPVWAIKNTTDYIDNNIKINDNLDKINENDNENDEDSVDLEVNHELNSSSLNQLTMYVNHKNKTNEIMSVTTSHAKFYYDEKQIPCPYKNECPILKLQPGQELSFSAVTVLGVERDDTMFSAVTIICYKQINEHEFDFTLESKGQLTEKRILQVALINIEKNMRNLIKLFLDAINKGIDASEEEGLIIINNEDHTLGNLISDGMRKHSKVEFAGYNLPHPLAKKVHFHYLLKKDGNIKKIIEDVVDYYSELFNTISKFVDKI